MRNLVCFLEEASAREMLKGVLPRLLPDDIQCHYIVFEGKQDLERQLVRKLRDWQKPDSAFLVMRDQDAAECRDVKNRLVTLCARANRPKALVRIACRELESFYFGDLAAVERGLEMRNLVGNQGRRRYRVPDAIVAPSRQLEQLTGGAYQKIGGSRRIGLELALEGNTSRSFNALLSGIRALFQREDGGHANGK